MLLRAFSDSLCLYLHLYIRPALCPAAVLHFCSLIDEGVKQPVSHKSKYRRAMQATGAEQALICGHTRERFIVFACSVKSFQGSSLA